ncbi:hypothetical protein M0R45_000021 [Rubus argutus]|uniref:Uncharacterized protein n=1 Tax=Rubus argutus TaxID=59490 RepID=A0AAW1VQZ8_RUBAR
MYHFILSKNGFLISILCLTSSPLRDLGHVRAENDDHRVLEEGLEELGRVVKPRLFVPYLVRATVIREIVHEAVGPHTHSEEVLGMVHWVKGTRTVVNLLSSSAMRPTKMESGLKVVVASGAAGLVLVVVDLRTSLSHLDGTSSLSVDDGHAESITDFDFQPNNGINSIEFHHAQSIQEVAFT